MKNYRMDLTEKQIFMLIDLVQDKIFMEQDINKVEKLEISDYLIELGNIEIELFDYQCKNF
jgi:hypothetical protein